jgi:hypothetical protein
LLLLAAPRDGLTALLVDRAGALWAAFRGNVEEDGKTWKRRSRYESDRQLHGLSFERE